ncbi:MAG: hypothetical protein ACQKBY_05570 [Verrucomicrobiales bacterium]
MPAPKPVEEPHKELRFTRVRQAQLFFVLTAVCLVVALLIFLSLGNPSLSWWMVLLPLLPAALSARIALHCTRHAYLILTPLGIEIFPFRQPEKNLQVRYWSEFAAADFSEDLSRLTLHFNAEKSAGLVLSLAPLAETQRELLEKALVARLAQVRKEN